MTNINPNNKARIKRHDLMVILMLVAATAVISYLLPQRNITNMIPEDYKVGKPWTHNTLFSPIEFPVEYSEEQVGHITDSVSTHFMRVYSRDDAKATSQLALLTKETTQHTEIPAHVRQHLLSDVQEAYRNGIVDSESARRIANGTMRQVRMLDENSVATVMSTDKFMSEKQLYTMLDTTYGAEIHSLNVRQFITPNVTLNQEENKKMYDSELGQALAPKGVVQARELIIQNGNIVTQAQVDKISSLRKKLSEGQNTNKENELISLIGQILLIVIIMITYWYFLRTARLGIYDNMRSMVFLISFITLFIAFFFALLSFRSSLLYVVPFAIVPIICCSFFDVRIASFTHVVVVLVSALVVQDPLQFILMQLLAGYIAVSSMQELSRRSQLMRCALLIFVAYSVTRVAIIMSHGNDFSHESWTHWFIFTGVNCFALSFSYVGVYLVERLFGFTSIMTLVELSDINSTALRRLSERCPGTFQHSLQVANIAAEAAIKVGARPQLVRAGALYHDIGKTENPAFFTENQSGVNPHDSLTPEQSAHIVLSHVTDGIAIAERNGLPQVIKDIILQHHGTSVTRYFYAQACKQAGQDVDPAPYTYPGPRPRTREAAIIMMADACEAAARSLKDYNEKSITALVEKIVEGQIASGQLKEAPISLAQIETVKAVYVERLKTFYHNRIAYPDDAKPASSDQAKE